MNDLNKVAVEHNAKLDEIIAKRKEAKDAFKATVQVTLVSTISSAKENERDLLKRALHNVLNEKLRESIQEEINKLDREIDLENKAKRISQTDRQKAIQEWEDNWNKENLSNEELIILSKGRFKVYQHSYLELDVTLHEE
jgi:hypothetical protein